MDRRGLAAMLAAVAILAGGLAVTQLAPRLPGEQRPAGSAATPVVPARHAQEVDTSFRQGVVMLHARQYEHAIAAFHQVLKYAPQMPEAHVNMGFALVGVGRHAAARDFFTSAMELRPRQANAYYGLAVALEALGDKPGAIGAMRTYLHLAGPDEPYRRKAEAALWEWQAAR